MSETILIRLPSNQRIKFSTTDSGAACVLSIKISKESLHENNIHQQLMWKVTGSFLSCSHKNDPVELRAPPPHLRERLENNDITYPSLVPSEWRLSGRN